MPKKPIKRGFKIWMIADSDSGYVSKFKVYEGKSWHLSMQDTKAICCASTNADPESTKDVEGKSKSLENGLGGKVAMTPTEDFHQRYRNIYFDNFFTGVDPLLNLLRHGTFDFLLHLSPS